MLALYTASDWKRWGSMLPHQLHSLGVCTQNDFGLWLWLCYAILKGSWVLHHEC